MSGSNSRLTLVIPQLFDCYRATESAPRLAALETVLSRADAVAREETSCEHHLFTLFGMHAEGELPVGAVRRLGDGASPEGGWWCCAEPVHFIADMDRLRMIPAEAFAISREEAAALVDLFNDHFAEDGWRLEAPHLERWYLRAPASQSIRTVPLEHALRQDLRSAFPSGLDGLKWRRFLNEVQMLFHSSAVNEARELRGELTINGFWPWGGGSAPSVARRFEAVVSDEPVSRGLALLSGVEPQQPTQWKETKGDVLVVLSAEMTEAWWSGAETQWFAPIKAALQHGQLSEVVIDGGSANTYRIDRRQLRRWWRRRRNLGAFA